jgi:hypothetical protein
LFEQIANDPDAKKLGVLMNEWYLQFGSKPMQIRKVVSEVFDCRAHDLHDAISEFPVEERGKINNGKFGWLLKKNANKVVNGMKFEKVEQGERLAWRVVKLPDQS